MRRSRRNPQGGRIQKEAPIHLSNVMPVSPKTGHGTRVRFKVEHDARGRVRSKQRLGPDGTVLSEVTRSEQKTQSRGG